MVSSIPKAWGAFLSISTNDRDGPLAIECREAALVITICRAHAGNSIDLATAEALSAALKSANSDRDIRAVILTGQGGKFFCSGGDVKAYRALDSTEDLQQVFGRVRDLLDEIECFRLPVLAAIDGYALGGGLELALACDQRFASTDARLGATQARLGLIPGWNGAERLVETVGRPNALRLLYLAEPIIAARALEIGLVDEVASSGTALDAALQFCRRMAATGPLGVEGAKAVVFAGLASQRAAGRDAARRTFERLWFTDDHREAEAAFAEKRPAMLKGR